MFRLTDEQLKEGNAGYTAQEIYQQPSVWKEMVAIILAQQNEIRNFIDSIYEKHERIRIIMTGAGTSAFAGDTLVPELNRQNQYNVYFESIATTDIVSNPAEYLVEDEPTIMVSFARSGNSPESLAAVSLAKKIIKNFYQVNITCNKEGKLAKSSEGDKNSLTILTPEQANDQSMAMTSSFSNMILAAYLLFSSTPINQSGIDQVISSGEHFVQSITDTIEQILEFDFERVIYLGSGLLGQLSHEAALKMLELTAGKVVAVNETSLGFRHGPKSILNNKSLVVIFMSQNSYTRKYDMDILREIAADELPFKTVVLAEKVNEEIQELADWSIQVNNENELFANDFYLALLYVIFAQALALKKSVKLGISPDNPSPEGRINRVVKGVTIYNYEK